MNMNINDVSIFVEESGAGNPALVFLHYWGGSHRTWSRVIQHLEKSYRCISYDSRGWGRSQGSFEGFRIADLADEGLSLIAALNLKHYVLIGHSMGGKVAQVIASRRPIGLEGLILVAPATPTPTHFPAEAFEQQLHAYDSRATVLQTIQFLSAKSLDAETIEQIVEDSLAGTPEATQAWPTLGIREDVSADVSKIAVPTIVLAGEYDNLDSVEQHQREVVSRIHGADLKVIKGSGHLIPLDEPDQLASAIEEFLKTRVASVKVSNG